MAYSDVINKLGQIKQNNLDLINSQIPPVKGDLTAGKDTKQPGGIPNRPYEAPQEDPKNPYVPAPKRLAGFPQEGGNVTEKGYIYDPDTGDVFINTPDGLINDGVYDVDIHGLFVPLAQQMMINKQTANLRPQDFTPFDMHGVRDMDGFMLPHIRTPAIREQEMKHFKRFIKNTGTSTWDLSQGNSPMMIAKKKKKKGLTIYQEKARRDAMKDMGDTIYDPDEGRMGGGFDIINDVLGLDEA